jgi:DNA-binding MarR family transcriptional regulator
VSTPADHEERPEDRPHPSTDDRLGYLLKHAQLRFAELAASALAPYGIDGREWAVLTSLDERASLSQREVARRLEIDRTTMVALVDQLEGKGLVQRRQDPDDRRRNLVGLTDTGRDTLRRAAPARDDAERRFLAPLPEDAAERFKQALRTLVTATERR